MAARILQLLRKGRSIASTNPTANPASPVTAGPVFASALPPGSALISSCATPTRGAARFRRTAAPATPPAPRANTADSDGRRSEKAYVKPVRAPANAAAQTTCVSGGACGLDCSDDDDACPPGSICWLFENASQCVPALGDCSVPPLSRRRIVRQATPATMASASPLPERHRLSGAMALPRRSLSPARCETDQECPQGTICQSRGASPAARTTAAVRWVRPVNQGAANRAATHADCPLDRACQAGQCVDEVCTGNDRALACQVDLFLPGTALRSQAQAAVAMVYRGLVRRATRWWLGNAAPACAPGTPTRRACTGDRDCAAAGEYCDQCLRLLPWIVSAHQDRPARAPTLRKTGSCSGGTCSNFRCASACQPEAGNCPVGFTCEEVRRAGGGGDRDLLPTRRWSSVSVAPLHVVRRGRWSSAHPAARIL